ncbi:MAG: 2-oxo acid dehydrogenase subunit E2, partial [Rhodothermales bacterium]|nr:2-oxo acid dehydrogenase subunit E2 [Rhodothermales bacterium]
MSTFGFNTGYVEDLYAQYLENPESVSERWREFFADYDPGPTFYPPQPASDGGAVAAEPPEIAEPVTEQKIEARKGKAPEPRPAGDGAREAAAPVAARAPERPAPPMPEGATTEPLRGAAARIVENMEASLEIPTATSARQVPVKLMAENRRLINDWQRSVGGEKVSYTHLIAYALVQALEAVPAMNTSFRRDNGTMERVVADGVNFGLAIDVERKNGQRSLLVPNIKHAEKLSFPEFVGAYNDLVRRARGGNLELADFQGTTATLTNPGMIGTVMSVPRLMPGQGVILAVGAIGYPPEYAALPPKEISRLGLSQTMTVTSTYDHRVIQGAESGEFLAHVDQLLRGEHGFYERVFRELGISIPPLKSSPDTTPVLGETDEMEMVHKQARVLQLVRAYRVR